MTKLLISACLLGHKVRYDGGDNLQNHPRLMQWVKQNKVISICPEMAGGLPTPRTPAEIEKGKTVEEVLSKEARILTVNGVDVTESFLVGAYKALQLAKQHNVKVAILKARSPSCGSSQVYDGTFSKTLIEGMGVTAALLTHNNIKVFNETQIDAALDLAEALK